MIVIVMMIAENKVRNVKSGRIKKKDAKKSAETNQYVMTSRAKKPFALLRTLFAVILALLAVTSHYLQPLVQLVTVLAFLFQ